MDQLSLELLKDRLFLRAREKHKRLKPQEVSDLVEQFGDLLRECSTSDAAHILTLLLKE